MMSEYEFSNHALDMLHERGIKKEWVWMTLASPNRKYEGDDGNLHYTKSIEDKEGRVLRVIVNFNVQPKRIVTLFFDRRLRKK